LADIVQGTGMCTVQFKEIMRRHIDSKPKLNRRLCGISHFSGTVICHKAGRSEMSMHLLELVYSVEPLALGPKESGSHSTMAPRSRLNLGLPLVE
jgi:hypothetical protein